MSLNTNGWDYGYHLNLEKVNKMILDNAAKDKTDVENFINSLNFPVSNNAITNITSLNSLIKDKIKLSVTPINNIKLYKDLPSTIFDNLANPSSVNLIDYLTGWLENILIEIHKVSKERDSLSLWAKTKYSTIIDSNFTDANEIMVLKNRAKIYLENEYYTYLYNFSNIFTVFNGIQQLSLATPFSINDNKDTKEKSQHKPNVKMTWTGSKVGLTELLFALHYQGTFNNGAADLKEIAEYLEYVFEIDLGQYRRTFLEIKARKEERTKFLVTLNTTLLKKMDNADDVI